MMKNKRNSRGKYRRSYWDNFIPVILLGITILVGLLVQNYFKETELRSPCENDGCKFFMVRAYEEPQATETVTEQQEATIIDKVETKDEIEAYIRLIFKEDGDLMVKIAKCESGLNPNNVGDTHIMGWHNGEYIGDSVGLFQIRTGDAGVYDKRPWNRAKANGMTAQEFRAWLQVPENNIKYAKDIYDRQGVYAWYNCYQKVK